MKPEGKRRRLTDRQAAILAAVERIGRPAMGDLWREFPDLKPSAIKKVLDSLESKGLVESAGDPAQVYLGGVNWWSTAIAPTRREDLLQGVVDSVREADLRIEVSVDDQERAVALFLPLVELESVIDGSGSSLIKDVSGCLQRLETEGVATRIAIASEIAAGPKPCLVVKLLPAAGG